MLQIVDFPKDALAFRQVGFSFLRQAEAARVARDQADAEAFFQLCQPFADCRGRDVELAGGGGKASALHQRGEKSEVGA